MRVGKTARFPSRRGVGSEGFFFPSTAQLTLIAYAGSSWPPFFRAPGRVHDRTTANWPSPSRGPSRYGPTLPSARMRVSSSGGIALVRSADPVTKTSHTQCRVEAFNSSYLRRAGREKSAARGSGASRPLPPCAGAFRRELEALGTRRDHFSGPSPRY